MKPRRITNVLFINKRFGEPYVLFVCISIVCYAYTSVIISSALSTVQDVVYS